ncbi:hypothetical protein C84B14_01220 [Salinisphaera sp. C84B14]
MKVKLATEEKQDRRAEVEQICERLEAACVQQIGRTATLYRPNPEKT